MRDLRAAFRSGTALPVVQVLTGMGGVGKTSLARAYAQRYLRKYGIVWWVRAEDPSAVDPEFRTLLEILLPAGEAAQVGNARAAAFAQLARQREPWLLVLDDVRDAAAAYGLLPPARNGHVLITSRATAWPDLYVVRPLDPSAAVELLTSRSGDADRESAQALAAELGGLPLALNQAAGFARANALDLATYLRLYRDRGAELHNEGRPADYPHTVATTWQLAMDGLTEPARDMLNVLAFCAPDAIPVSLLFAGVDELIRRRAVGELYSHSLITPAGKDTVTVHRLVQAVTRDRLGPRTYEWADRTRRLIMTAMPRGPVTAANLATWNCLHTHVRALLDHLPHEHIPTQILRHDLAALVGEAGDLARARDLLAELLAVRERVLGADHPDTLATRHDLAFWIGKAGDARAARDLLAELLPIRERVLGAEHPDTLRTRHDLARWMGNAGNPVGARDLYGELLPMRERVLGTEHPDTLKTRHRLARWTEAAGDPARARDMFRELLPVCQRVLGADHLDTLKVAVRLAHCIGQTGDAATARDLLAELLPRHERVAGVERRRTLRHRYRLAHWTGVAGDAARARDLLAELLPVHERVLGVEHPETLSTRRELVRLAGLAGDVEEMEPGGSREG